MAMDYSLQPLTLNLETYGHEAYVDVNLDFSWGLFLGKFRI